MNFNWRCGNAWEGISLVTRLQLQGVCSHQKIPFFQRNTRRRDGVSYLLAHTMFKGPIKRFPSILSPAVTLGFSYMRIKLWTLIRWHRSERPAQLPLPSGLASNERAEADPRWCELSGEDHHARSQPQTRITNPAGSTIRIGVLIALRARIAAFAIMCLDQLLPFLRTAWCSPRIQLQMQGKSSWTATWSQSRAKCKAECRNQWHLILRGMDTRCCGLMLCRVDLGSRHQALGFSGTTLFCAR